VIKSQALDAFAAEISSQSTEAKGTQWTLYVNESSNSRSCNVGVVLEGLGNILVEQALKFEFKASNNQAEYEAIIAGLNLTINLDIKQLLCKSDSQLVARQLKDEFEVQEKLLQQYYHFVKNLLTKFSEVTIDKCLISIIFHIKVLALMRIYC